MSISAPRLLAGAFLLTLPLAAQGLDIQPVLVTGDPAPLPTFGPAVFNGGSSLADYSINEHGDLALNVGIIRANPPFPYYPIVFGSGLWIRRDGVLSYVAASGELLPNDTSGEVLALRDIRSFNRSGKVAIAAAEATNISPIAFSGSGASLYFGDESGLVQIASKEDPALSPELPAGTNYRGWGVPADATFSGIVRLNDAGQIAYIGQLEGTSVDNSNNEALLLGTDQAASVLIREGDAAPGFGPGVVIGCPSCNAAGTFGNPRLSSQGDIVLRARLTGPGIGTFDDLAIYSFSGGSQQLVARTQAADPSLDRIRFLTEPETNDQGLVLFRALFGPLASPAGALFYGPPAGAQPVLRVGDAAPRNPGLEIRALFDDTANPIKLPIAAPVMNGLGQVVLAVNLEGPGVTPETERALYFGTPGSLQEVARAGDQLQDAPGTRLLSVGKFATNAAGTVVFEALIAPVGSFDAQASLWAWAPGHSEPFLVAREGQALPFGSSTRIPTLVTFRGGPGAQGGFGGQLNDSSVLLFEASYPGDAAGIYEADLFGNGGPIGERYCDPANVNSSGTPGELSITGSPRASANQVTLTASNLPPNAFGFFLTSRTQAMVANPNGSQGILCVGGAVGRYVGPGEIRNSGGAGSFALSLDVSQTPTPTGFVSVQAGETWNFQAWHRDVVGGVATSNLTDAVSVTFE